MPSAFTKWKLTKPLIIFKRAGTVPSDDANEV